MAIQMRRGLIADVDPSKMLPGEWGVTIDKDTNRQIVLMCFEAGIVKRMGTYEDFKKQIADATDDIRKEYLAEFQEILDQIDGYVEEVRTDTNTVVAIRDDFLNAYLPQIQDCLSKSKNYASNASASESNAKTYANTASEKAIEASNSSDKASDCLNSIEIKTTEIRQMENDVTQMKSDVSSMKSDVALMQEKVSQDKTDIETTIQESLMSKTEEILAAMKDYYDRAQELYNSMYIDCDGETPHQRVVTIVSIDCGTPQSRLHDTNGILFNGGTPLNRQLAS